MWILCALIAAFFAGITSVFAKIGVNNIDSKLATALRTIVILIFSLIVVLITGSLQEIKNIDVKTIIFIVLSGITTAVLWLTYFKALKLADVSKISPIDKTSIILTLILSNLFLNEKITLVKIISMLLIAIGSWLMTSKKNNVKEKSNQWIFYAILTAIFTSLATIFGKIGIDNINLNLATLLKTIVAAIVIWSAVFITKKDEKIKNISKKSWTFIFLSGITTGLSWTFYFLSLRKGEASLVFSIEKLSIVVAVLFSIIFLNEKLSKKAIIGLIIIIFGTLLLLI